MTETNGVTAPDVTAAPAGEAEASAAAAVVAPDELGQLRSRNSGLNAKVTELQSKLAAEQASRTAAEQAVADKAGTDDVLNKRIAELQAEIEAGKKATALAQAAAKAPEAYALLGDGIASMPSENLAALEARLTAAKDEGAAVPETPKPVGNNQQRTGAGKNIDDMTSEELQAAIKGLPREAFFGTGPR